MDSNDNVIQFPVRAAPLYRSEEESALFERLDRIADADERLVALAHHCVKNRDLELTDTLLVEAHQRNREARTPEAWYAIATYAFLHDQENRYWGIQQVRKYSAGRPRYSAMCLDLITHTDATAPKAREYCARLTNDLLQYMPDDTTAMDIVVQANRDILGIPEEFMREEIRFSRHRKRFRMKDDA